MAILSAESYNFFMSYTIEKNDCSDLDELIELSKSYYTSGDIIDKNYLHWQYLKNPAGVPFLFTSRENATGNLAGQYLVIPTNYQINGIAISGSLSLNTLTHPDHRGKGLFTKMANATYVDCAKNDNYFTTGFPNPMSYPGFVKKLDFTHLGDIPLLVKPLKPFKIAMSYFKKGKEKHGDEIDFKSAEHKKNIREFDFNNEEDKQKYNSFWNKVKTNYPISTNKDFDFLKWRYCDHPTKKYKVFCSFNGSDISGLIIMRAEYVWGFNAGIIMDVMLLDFEDKVLLRFASKSFRKMNLDFIVALHSNIREHNTLKKSGFFNIPQKLLPQKIHYIVRKNKAFESEGEIIKAENWKLTFGDYDIF